MDRGSFIVHGGLDRIRDRSGTESRIESQIESRTESRIEFRIEFRIGSLLYPLSIVRGFVVRAASQVLEKVLSDWPEEEVRACRSRKREPFNSAPSRTLTAVM